MDGEEDSDGEGPPPSTEPLPRRAVRDVPPAPPEFLPSAPPDSPPCRAGLPLNRVPTVLFLVCFWAMRCSSVPGDMCVYHVPLNQRPEEHIFYNFRSIHDCGVRRGLRPKLCQEIGVHLSQAPYSNTASGTGKQAGRLPNWAEAVGMGRAQPAQQGGLKMVFRQHCSASGPGHAVQTEPRACCAGIRPHRTHNPPTINPVS